MWGPCKLPFWVSKTIKSPHPLGCKCCANPLVTPSYLPPLSMARGGGGTSHWLLNWEKLKSLSREGKKHTPPTYTHIIWSALTFLLQVTVHPPATDCPSCTDWSLSHPSRNLIKAATQTHYNSVTSPQLSLKILPLITHMNFCVAIKISLLLKIIYVVLSTSTEMSWHCDLYQYLLAGPSPRLWCRCCSLSRWGQQGDLWSLWLLPLTWWRPPHRSPWHNTETQSEIKNNPSSILKTIMAFQSRSNPNNFCSGLWAHRSDKPPLSFMDAGRVLSLLPKCNTHRNGICSSGFASLQQEMTFLLCL